MKPREKAMEQDREGERRFHSNPSNPPPNIAKFAAHQHYSVRHLSAVIPRFTFTVSLYHLAFSNTIETGSSKFTFSFDGGSRSARLNTRYSTSNLLAVEFIFGCSWAIVNKSLYVKRLFLYIPILNSIYVNGSASAGLCQPNSDRWLCVCDSFLYFFFMIFLGMSSFLKVEEKPTLSVTLI